MTYFISVMELIIGHEELVYYYVLTQCQLMFCASAYSVIHSQTLCDLEETKVLAV
jgi:hypothetical protein